MTGQFHSLVTIGFQGQAGPSFVAHPAQSRGHNDGSIPLFYGFRRFVKRYPLTHSGDAGADNDDVSGSSRSESDMMSPDRTERLHQHADKS